MNRLFLSLGCAVALSFSSLSLSSCSTAVDYTEYVSEYRSEIYLAEEEGYSLTAFFSEREYPYCADGVCAKLENLVEVYLTVPDNTKNYELSFTAADGKECGGDMSYDSVHARFFYSQSMDAISSPDLKFTVTFEENSVTLEAKNVRTGTELTMPEIIGKLAEQKPTLLESLTNGKNFMGELYVRLVYNEKCYYFIGVCTKEGLKNCFLLDACSGTVMAERNNG